VASGVRFNQVLLALILAIYALLALAYNALQPIGEAPDEPAHLEFIQYLQQHQALPPNLPQAPAHLDPLAPGIEFDQVPLYYASLAVLLRPIWLPPNARLHRDPFIGWPGHPWQRANDLHWTDEGWPYHGLSLFVHAGRLFSTVLGLITLLATNGIVRRILNPAAALFAASWLGWNPGFVLSSSHLNNDNAAIAASSVVILCATRMLTSAGPPTWLYASTSVALAAALLSKIHTLFLIPLVAVAVASAVDGKKNDLRLLFRRSRAVALVLAPPLGLLAVWWITVGHTYDRRLNVAVGVGVAGATTRFGEIDWSRLPAALWWFNSTWWGGIGAGVETLWQSSIYAFLAAPVVVLAAGGLYTCLRPSSGVFVEDKPADRRQDWRWPAVLVALWDDFPPRRRATLLLILTAIPLLYATITRQVFPWVDLDANSRFVLPVAPTIALVVTLGGMALPLGRARRPLAIAYALGMLGLAIATAFVLLPQISAPRIPARLAASPAEGAAVPIATFANGIELMAVDDIPPTIGDGVTPHLTLRWRVAQPSTENFIVFTHLVGRREAGLVSSGHDEIPFQKLFPPTLWQVGEIVDQPQDLKTIHDLPPGVYTLEVGMYYLRGDKISPIAVAGANASAANSAVVASWKELPADTIANSGRAVGATFGDDLALDRESVSKQSDGIQVTLLWRALRSPTRPLVVSVQALDPSGRLLAQHDGEPVDGRLPTTTWSVGDIVEDSHVVRGPPPDANLTLIVAVYDRETVRRLPVSVPGQPNGDHVKLVQ
jgi:hypothetical protein